MIVEMTPSTNTNRGKELTDEISNIASNVGGASARRHAPCYAEHDEEDKTTPQGNGEPEER